MQKVLQARHREYATIFARYCCTLRYVPFTINCNSRTSGKGRAGAKDVRGEGSVAPDPCQAAALPFEYSDVMPVTRCLKCFTQQIEPMRERTDESPNRCVADRPVPATISPKPLLPSPSNQRRQLIGHCGCVNSLGRSATH